MILFEEHGDVVHIRMTRTLLGRPVYWTGAYLVRDLLVDCGPPALASELLKALEGRTIAGLVVTHHHEDHSGGAPLWQARRGIVPQIHAAGVPLLERGFPVEFYRRVAWGRRRNVPAESLGGEVRTGSVGLEVVHTPGHSPDHVCFFEPERGWLFTGDLFLAERLRYLRDDEDLDALIDSLEAVGRLPLRQVFCAHRGLVRDGPAALRRKAQHLRELRARVLDLLQRGWGEGEIARQAIGPEGPLTWFSLGRFSVRNFVRAVSRGALRA